MLGTSIDKAGLARLQINRILMAHGVMDPVPIPDLSTKEKAQAYIGLDMAKLTSGKGRIPADGDPTMGQGGR